MNIRDWLRQPTTIHGIALLAATAAGVGMWFYSHSAGDAVAIGSGLAGVIMVALPDNSGDKSSVSRMIEDTVKMLATKQYVQMAPVIMADLQAMLTPAHTATTTVSATTTAPDGTAKTEAVTETVSTPVPVTTEAKV